MSENGERLIIHKLILAREFGQQGYRWNRAFRQQLWRRLTRGQSGRTAGRRADLSTGPLNTTDRDDGN